MVKLKSFAAFPVYGFEGLGQGLDFEVTAPEPDIAGSVGVNQYVEWVKNEIAVFNKTDGSLVEGFPKPSRTIWSGFGPECQGNAGPSSIKYDQLAHRWFLAQNVYTDRVHGPFYECIAISTSEDAAGSYYRYAFQMDSYNDWGRMGLWPDSYLMAFTMSGAVSNGPRACAFERDKMLIGEAASMYCKQLIVSDTGFIPSDLIGALKPAVGAPSYFMSLNAPDGLLVYRLHVDFSHIQNSVLTGPIDLPVLPYVRACPATSGHECAIQPGTTNKLDLLVDRPTRQMIYKQLPGYASLIVTHTIQGNAPELAPAIRWYEFRVKNPIQNPVIYQQATLAPDSKHRYLGSMGVDRVGDIAMGYTVSSSSIYPSMEFAGRNYYDTLNTMTIQPLHAGKGSQHDIGNWGRYSAMSLDPIDNCTFWYAGEYLRESGSYNWHTYIVHFKMPGCT